MNIDKIFIINLASRPDRKTQIINEMKKQNINENKYEIFNAIRPSIEEINSWNTRYCEHVKKDVHPKNFDGYKKGSLGCLKSHTEVCKLALSRGYKNVLILEDDTEFIDNYNKLEEYSNQINNDYDMLYLSGSHLGKKNEITKNISSVTGTHTTGSYCIKEKAMNYLINNINGYSKEIDVFYACEIQPKFNCYIVIPHITKQRDGYSDIQQNNVSYKL